MDELIEETALLKVLAKQVIDLVRDTGKEMAIAESKGIGDYSTLLDIEAEKLIVSGINARFPEDLILAEEGHSDTIIPNTRIWIIDPICGTNNLGKGINNFCTNIALADKNRVIAACVVDHSQGEYIMSTGNGLVLVDDKPFISPGPELGQKVDIDFGSVRKAGPEMAIKHNKFLLKLIQETDFDIVSLNSSLPCAYISIGKIDGFIQSYCHTWDIAASSYLIQQSGGMISALDGSDWNLNTVGAIAGRTPDIHHKLLTMFLDS